MSWLLVEVRLQERQVDLIWRVFLEMFREIFQNSAEGYASNVLGGMVWRL